MKKIALILITMLALSCKTLQQDNIGNYTVKRKDYTYSLTLRKDSTFIFIKTYHEYNSKCEGKWNFTTKDSIVLYCNKEDFPAQMTMGYMSEREQRIKVINSKKIKISNIILKKNY